VRSYIFPKSEVKVLKAFLDEGVKLDGFRDEKYRILKHHKLIREHYRLMEQFLERLKAET
jgi:hypothetical protein